MTKYLEMSYIFITFVIEKKNRYMNNEIVINRTTLNGYDWQIVADKFGAALMLKNYNKEGYHFSGNHFRTIEEANAYLNKIDEKYLKPEPVASFEVPADYYGVAGRYYGD